MPEGTPALGVMTRVEIGAGSRSPAWFSLNCQGSAKGSGSRRGSRLVGTVSDRLQGCKGSDGKPGNKGRRTKLQAVCLSTS